MKSRKFLHISLTVTLLVVHFLCSCSDRERLNPIDPQNPETGGRPQGLRVYSEYDQATLRWLNIQLNNFLGYNIYRKSTDDTSFQFIYLTPPDSQVFIDKNLTYDTKYQYYITVKAQDFESRPSDTVSVTPGPTFIWASDVTFRYVLKLTHDCTSVIKRVPIDGYPYAIEMIPGTGELWYTDILMNRVYAIDGQFNQRIVDDFETGEPIDLSFDKFNDRVWIADETRGKIHVYRNQGSKIFELDKFVRPYSLESYQSDGACWLADRDGDTIYKLGINGGIDIQIDSLYRPTDVTVNQETGDCWVADSSRVLLYNKYGILKLTIDQGLIYPLDVAVDSELGNCWVLDFSYFDQNSKLLCFSSSGEKLVELTGLTQPENLYVNPYDHSCIVAESGAGRILKISESGKIIGESGNHAFPYGLTVEYSR